MAGDKSEGNSPLCSVSFSQPLKINANYVTAVILYTYVRYIYIVQYNTV